MRRRSGRVPAVRSGFAGIRFHPDVITLAVRWCLRYGLSCRNVEELLAERGITVDHVTVYRWVRWFTPLLIDVAQPCRHVPGDQWSVDETATRRFFTRALGHGPYRAEVIADRAAAYPRVL
ncbi:MAG TPA: IS6 family transposase, partial [Pseudonocardiaceae bacterium]|nr:IS6 family transposase [Pseudonocardiaceae bacterium]